MAIKSLTATYLGLQSTKLFLVVRPHLDTMGELSLTVLTRPLNVLRMQEKGEGKQNREE